MTKTAWLLPLEPITARYTEQWYRKFPIAFESQGYNVRVIDGETLSDTIDVGSWLPMNSTVVWKNTQVSTIARAFQNKEIKDGDILFSYDLEHWGISAIKMMAQINNVDLKIFAFLHAASYTKEDLMEQLAPWQKYTELGWFSLCDKIFVGTEYHKQAVIDRRIKPYAAKEDHAALSDKIVVTGNPIFRDEYKSFNTSKKNQIILPNRFDWEKRPNVSLDIAYLLKKKHQDWNVVITTSNPKFRSNRQWLIDKARAMEADGIIEIKDNLTKDEYHALMHESKIMLTNSIEENFGYCIAEAMLYNTYPLAPRGLSHTELCHNNDMMLYDDLDEVVEKAEALMCSTFCVDHLVAPFFTVADKIAALTLKD